MSGSTAAPTYSNRKATKAYLEAFYDAARLQTEANRIATELRHNAEVGEQLERDRLNWWHSRPTKRQRTLTDTTTGMTSTRKRTMGFAGPGAVARVQLTRTAEPLVVNQSPGGAEPSRGVTPRRW